MEIEQLLMAGAIIRSLLWVGILLTALVLVNQYIRDHDDHRLILRIFQVFLIVLKVIIIVHVIIQFLALGE